ncbi:hypothetical protein PILCRDRAFT_347952 [Piloderma croceum F 1598]|uniref:Uncharacterized protein n=1 Tax=Piloderma croceum (strain F 1598) TaxID=765440 RepID=A0A0C3G5D2_PILCF|nr:hypothetical protein PILCRDRAFT_347952 [Piloderma croceum F 1598]
MMNNAAGISAAILGSSTTAASTDIFLILIASLPTQAGCPRCAWVIRSRGCGTHQIGMKIFGRGICRCFWAWVRWRAISFWRRVQGFWSCDVMGACFRSTCTIVCY